MKTKQGAKILQGLSGIVIFLILVRLSKSSSKSSYSNVTDNSQGNYEYA